MSNNSIGENIKKYRIKNNLLQEDLAEKTELSTNYIGMIERGEKNPSLETFIKIINALNVSTDIILSDVINHGYKVKNSMLTEIMETLNKEDKDRIYDVVEVLLLHNKKEPGNNTDSIF